MEDLQRQNYELAFHITPDMEEAKAKEIQQSIEALITSHEGVITFSKEPTKTHLSYPVKRHNYSFFGFTQFGVTSTELLKSLDEQLKMNTDVIRYLLLKLESDQERRTMMIQRAKMQEKRAKARASAQAKAAPAEKVDKQKMEAQLEDVIEKL